MKFKTIALAALIAALGAAAMCAEDVLPSKTAAAFDGTVDPAHYSFIRDYSGMRLGASLSADGKVLTLAISAPTTGWVSIGLGSLVMNGAYMVMGVGAGGQAGPQVLEQASSGHRHGDANGTKLLKSSAKTANGATTLEFSVTAADFVKDGKLDLILAYATTPDFHARHSARTSASLTVKN